MNLIELKGVFEMTFIDKYNHVAVNMQTDIDNFNHIYKNLINFITKCQWFYLIIRAII